MASASRLLGGKPPPAEAAPGKRLGRHSAFTAWRGVFIAREAVWRLIVGCNAQQRRQQLMQPAPNRPLARRGGGGADVQPPLFAPLAAVGDVKQ